MPRPPSPKNGRATDSCAVVNDTSSASCLAAGTMAYRAVIPAGIAGPSPPNPGTSKKSTGLDRPPVPASLKREKPPCTPSSGLQDRWERWALAAGGGAPMPRAVRAATATSLLTMATSEGAGWVRAGAKQAAISGFQLEKQGLTRSRPGLPFHGVRGIL